MCGKNTCGENICGENKCGENMRGENKCGENLPVRFEDWMYRECRIKKKTIYNYKNLFKLMRTAPKCSKVVEL